MSHALVRRTMLLALTCVGLFACASGFGATSATQLPTANVLASISLTDPVAKAADPPVCTDAGAPLDTDNCTDVTFTPGATKVLKLGSLSGTDVQAGSLRWMVSTSSATGYVVRMSNSGAAPVLRSASSSIADMQTGPLVPTASVDDATGFGVAMGDPSADNEAAVDFAGSPWVASGQQGEQFSGIPIAGMEIAKRTTPQSNDPFTATFAVAATAGQQPTPGSYAGTVRIIASIV